MTIKNHPGRPGGVNSNGGGWDEGVFKQIGNVRHNGGSWIGSVKLWILVDRGTNGRRLPIIITFIITIIILTGEQMEDNCLSSEGESKPLRRFSRTFFPLLLLKPSIRYKHKYEHIFNTHKHIFTWTVQWIISSFWAINCHWSRQLSTIAIGLDYCQPTLPLDCSTAGTHPSKACNWSSQCDQGSIAHKGNKENNWIMATLAF